MSRTFVGFGFGAIQGGLFLYEARRSNRFDRLVVAEVVPEVVTAVRRSGGTFHVNVATAVGLERRAVDGVEILNPNVPGEAARLVEAISEADEIATALPSVDFYDRGDPSPAVLLAEGLKARAMRASARPCVIYTGENHNQAAERLEDLVWRELVAKMPKGVPDHQFLNTVIGKMSGIVSDPDQIRNDGLDPIAPGLPRAFLVEAFNRILISKVYLDNFERGIEVFTEKQDLLPFEEAKLYGHNAVHALLGYLAERKGYTWMSEALQDRALYTMGREAFIEESGRALIRKHAGIDPLFTPTGYAVYVDDLLERMGNPYLHDRVDRVIRDSERKLQWNDRLIGTMRFVLEAGIEPNRFALGAAVALEKLLRGSNEDREERLRTLWQDAATSASEKEALIHRIRHTGRDTG